MRILSVNVGERRELTVKSRTVQTGIYKIPASGPVKVSRMGLQDDVLIEKREMGREHSAVYAYPFEHYAFWQEKLDREPFPMGQFGENITVTGLLEEEVRIGDIFRFGNTVLQVAHPRIPCRKLNAKMGLRFAPMFLASRKVGFYMRVLSEGTVAKDDTIELLERDDTSPTMEEFVRIAHYEYWDTEALQHLLQARDLMPAWKETIESKIRLSLAANGWHGMREFEIVNRKLESEDTVSLNLKCIRNKALTPFHGGQRILVVLGGRGGGANQERQRFYLSSDPRDCSTYRITVRKRDGDPNKRACSVSSHLFDLEEGEHLLCNAPHGEVKTLPDETSDRVPILISQGLGLAPLLSLLYELEGLGVRRIIILHESETNEPQGLLNELNAVVERNPDFQLIRSEPQGTNAALIRQHIPLRNSEIHVAGSAQFNLHIINECMSLDISPGALINFQTD